MHSYDKDTLTAFNAITRAQHIAFAPMLFQATIILRDCGVMEFLDKQGKAGALLSELEQCSSLSEYAIDVLLDMGLSAGIIFQRDERYFISKTGYFIFHDKMTRVNMDFTQHVCYQGLFHLKESLETGKPVGLSVFGDWPTIYPALAQLPESARNSWFAFDHYYSDTAYAAVLPHIFALNPGMIYDVGGNTGKWAIRCCEYHQQVNVTILDLPQQITLAQKVIEQAGLAHRIRLYPVDMLDNSVLPQQADIWWMSQFLDCFSPQQIIAILQRVAAAMKPDAWLCILELFWDRQKFEAGAFSLNASSLYFSCMANGCSRFYRANRFLDYIRQAGFVLEKQIDDLGIGHTLLICRKQ